MAIMFRRYTLTCTPELLNVLRGRTNLDAEFLELVTQVEKVLSLPNRAAARSVRLCR
jgi:hypothetical protein